MGDVFVVIEDDGSQWVMLEDYQALQQKYLLGELALEEQIKRNSALLQAAEHGEQPTVLTARHKLVSCPQCLLVFGVDLPASHIG